MTDNDLKTLSMREYMHVGFAHLDFAGQPVVRTYTRAKCDGATKRQAGWQAAGATDRRGL